MIRILALVAMLAINFSPTIAFAQENEVMSEVGVAKNLIIASVGLLNAGKTDEAIGYATVALDILRVKQENVLEIDVEKLLVAYRTIGLMDTAVDQELRGEPVAARGIAMLACTMAGKVAPELLELVQRVIKICAPI